MENTSGMKPLDLRILVKPDVEQEMTAGGIIKPAAVRDKAKYAATNATLVAGGSNAFVEWGDHALKPKPGQRVLFAQFSGAREPGKDGEDYVVMNDKDLLAVWDDDQ